MGAVGYFPTYTLGNLYAAQLWDAILRDIPDVEERIGRGEFAPLLGWLREKIHRFGRMYPAGELCERATGKPLSAEPFVRHLSAKLRPLYGV
jgi:carboxypeptidase Taq